MLRFSRVGKFKSRASGVELTNSPLAFVVVLNLRTVCLISVYFFSVYPLTLVLECTFVDLHFLPGLVLPPLNNKERRFAPRRRARAAVSGCHQLNLS